MDDVIIESDDDSRDIIIKANKLLKAKGLKVEFIFDPEYLDVNVMRLIKIKENKK